MEKGQTRIITASSRPDRSLLPYANAVDLRAVSTDFSNRIPTVGGNAVSKLLLAVSDGYYALAISIPGYIINTATYDRVFAFCSTLADTVPDAYSSGNITAGDVVARRGETSDCCRSCVSSVLCGMARIVYRSKEDGFVGLCKESQSTRCRKISRGKQLNLNCPGWDVHAGIKTYCICKAFAFWV